MNEKIDFLYMVASALKSCVKFIYSEKATKFCEITLLLSYVVPVKSKVKISHNFVAFWECMNFNSCIRIQAKAYSGLISFSTYIRPDLHIKKICATK